MPSPFHQPERLSHLSQVIVNSDRQASEPRWAQWAQSLWEGPLAGEDPPVRCPQSHCHLPSDPENGLIFCLYTYTCKSHVRDNHGICISRVQYMWTGVMSVHCIRVICMCGCVHMTLMMRARVPMTARVYRAV